MSSKTKKKDKKKSKKEEPIELNEIAEESILTSDASPSIISATELTGQRQKYKIKVIPAFGSQTEAEYEEEAAAALNSAGEDYKLLWTMPSPKSDKLIAFFELEDKGKKQSKRLPVLNSGAPAFK